MGREKILYVLGIGFLLGMTGCTGAKDDRKPSEIIFEGTYKVDGVDNMEFIFSKNSTLKMNQWGVYEMTKDEEGGQIVRLCLDDTSRELPEDYNFMEYKVTEKRNSVELTYLPAEDAETPIEVKPMELVLLKGKDGLKKQKKFSGTYQIGTGGDSYRYVFSKDGSINIQVNEHYYADKTTITLYDYAGTTEYLYQQEEDIFTLKNQQGDIIFELVKQDE